MECSGWLGLNSSSVRLTFFFGQRPTRVAKFLNAALVLLTASLPRGCQLMHIAKPMKKMGAPGMMGITQPTRPRTMTGIPRRAMMVLRKIKAYLEITTLWPAEHSYTMPFRSLSRESLSEPLQRLTGHCTFMMVFPLSAFSARISQAYTQEPRAQSKVRTRCFMGSFYLHLKSWQNQKQTSRINIIIIKPDLLVRLEG